MNQLIDVILGRLASESTNLNICGVLASSPHRKLEILKIINLEQQRPLLQLGSREKSTVFALCDGLLTL